MNAFNIPGFKASPSPSPERQGIDPLSQERVIIRDGRVAHAAAWARQVATIDPDLPPMPAENRERRPFPVEEPSPRPQQPTPIENRNPRAFPAAAPVAPREPAEPVPRGSNVYPIETARQGLEARPAAPEAPVAATSAPVEAEKPELTMDSARAAVDAIFSEGEAA